MAQYTITTKLRTLDVDGNIISKVGGYVSNSVTAEEGTTVTLTCSNKSGYKFNGWRVNTDGEYVSYNTVFNVTVTRDRTFTAVFQQDVTTAKKFRIDYNLNGGIIADQPHEANVNGFIYYFKAESDGTLVKSSAPTGTYTLYQSAEQNIYSSAINLLNVSTYNGSKTGYHIESDKAYLSPWGNILSQSSCTPDEIFGGDAETNCVDGSSYTLNVNWIPDEYILHFYSNTTDTVSNLPADKSGTYTRSCSVPSNVPLRTGYRFLGWSISSNLQQAYTFANNGVWNYSPTDTFTWEYPHDYYAVAVWEAKASYTVSGQVYTDGIVSSTGGSITGYNTYFDGDTVTMTATPTSGYRFSHWAYSGSTSSSNPYTFTITGNTTINAYFETIPPTSFTITFKTGSTVLGTQTMNATGGTLTPLSNLSDPHISSTYGWSFYGWSINPDTSREYTDGGNISSLSGDLTLYGIWQRSISCVYYNSASATSTTTSNYTQNYYNSGVSTGALSQVSPNKLYTQTTYGWTPLGWVNHSTTGASIAYNAGNDQAITMQPAIDTYPDYYACYTRSIRIAYNSNTSTPSQSYSSAQTQYYNVGSGADTHVFILSTYGGTVPTGYTFSKWAAGSTSGTQYSPGTQFTFPNTSWTTSSDYIMYAIWEQLTGTLSYDHAGTMKFTNFTESMSYENSVSTKPYSGNYVAPTGYTAKGWAISLDHAFQGIADYGFGVTYKNANSLTNTLGTTVIPDGGLLAYVLVSTLSFDANGHGVAPASQEMHYKGVIYATAMSNVTGYTFRGWSTTKQRADAGNIDYPGDSVYKADQVGYLPNATLYASWTPTVYTITYDLDGGTVSTPNPSTYTIETSTFTLNNPQKSKYTFNGWKGSNGNTPQVTVTIPTGSYGDKSYTATYNPNLTFYYGINDQYNVEVGYVDPNLPVTPSARSGLPKGWEFYGWTVDGGTTVVSANTPVNPSAGLTYHAVYHRTVTLSYTSNGGSGSAPNNSTGTQTYISNGTTSGVTIILQSNTFKPPAGDFRFNSWYTENTTTSAGSSYTWSSLSMSSDPSLSVSARWWRSIFFVKNTNSLVHVDNYYNEPVVFPTPDTLTNWEFTGYRNDDTVAQKQFNIGSQVYNDVPTHFYPIFIRTVQIKYEPGTLGEGNPPQNSTTIQYYSMKDSNDNSNRLSTPIFVLAANTFTVVEGRCFWKWDIGEPGSTYTGFKPSLSDSGNSLITTATALWIYSDYEMIIYSDRGFVYNSNSLDTHLIDGQTEVQGWPIHLLFHAPQIPPREPFEGLNVSIFDHSYILKGFYDESGELVFDKQGESVNSSYFENEYWIFESETVQVINVYAVWKNAEFIYDDTKRRIPYSGGDSIYQWEDNL